MAEMDCRHFSGYKPCAKNPACDIHCPHLSRVKERILIIHLEALGAVLRTTSLLPALRRKYPNAQVTWITKAPAHELLKNIPLVDRVLTLSPEDLLRLSALKFDLAFVLDKSLVAEGILRQTAVEKVYGFRADTWNGSIVPATTDAKELWDIGLSDYKKFFENKKSEQQLMHEACALGEYRRDEYVVTLDPNERETALLRRCLWSPRGAPILGINTGCSATLPHKKLSVENHRQLITLLRKTPSLRDLPIVLLGGGPEDQERNQAIAFNLDLISSPTDKGLRDGFTSLAACDLVVTGDSLGMHMAIGLRKWVVAWFGPSVAAEVELYDRGYKIQAPVACSPCWKRDCQQSKMCYDQLDLQQVLLALEEGLQWLTLSSKPRSPGTFFSPSL